MYDILRLQGHRLGISTFVMAGSQRPLAKCALPLHMHIDDLVKVRVMHRFDPRIDLLFVPSQVHPALASINRHAACLFPWHQLADLLRWILEGDLPACCEAPRPQMATWFDLAFMPSIWVRNSSLLCLEAV